MKHATNVFWVLALLALAACAKEELPVPAAGDEAVATRGENLPLQGEMIIYSVSRSFAGATATERWEGRGQFADLGGTSVVVHQSVTSGVLSGEMELTAANGDRLYWTYTGGLTSFDRVTLRVTSAISFTITGGAGRFSGATGSGTGTGSGVFPNFPPGPNDIMRVRIKITGVISY